MHETGISHNRLPFRDIMDNDVTIIIAYARTCGFRDVNSIADTRYQSLILLLKTYLPKPRYTMSKMGRCPLSKWKLGGEGLGVKSGL